MDRRDRAAGRAWSRYKSDRPSVDRLREGRDSGARSCSTCHTGYTPPVGRVATLSEFAPAERLKKASAERFRMPAWYKRNQQTCGDQHILFSRKFAGHSARAVSDLADWKSAPASGAHPYFESAGSLAGWNSDFPCYLSLCQLDWNWEQSLSRLFDTGFTRRFSYFTGSIDTRLEGGKFQTCQTCYDEKPGET